MHGPPFWDPKRCVVVVVVVVVVVCCCLGKDNSFRSQPIQAASIHDPKIEDPSSMYDSQREGPKRLGS